MFCKCEASAHTWQYICIGLVVGAIKHDVHLFAEVGIKEDIVLCLGGGGGGVLLFPKMCRMM
jgi:hypothetical protein